MVHTSNSSYLYYYNFKYYAYPDKIILPSNGILQFSNKGMSDQQRRLRLKITRGNKIIEAYDISTQHYQHITRLVYCLPSVVSSGDWSCQSFVMDSFALIEQSLKSNVPYNILYKAQAAKDTKYTK